MARRPVRALPEPLAAFDLERDRGETQDIAAEHPEIVADLARECDAYVRRAGVILDDTLPDGGGASDAGALGALCGASLDGGISTQR